MKVVLVRPNYNSHIITPPLGLGYLASFLSRRGVEVKIIDALRDALPTQTVVTQVLAEKADAVGITCLTAFCKEVRKLSLVLKATIEMTIRFACRSKLSRAQFLILDVIPGSELWTTLAGKFHPDWSKNSYKEPEWLPEGLSREQLLRAQSRAFRSFYSNPSRFLALASSIKPAQITFLAKRLCEYRVLGLQHSRLLNTSFCGVV